MAGGGGAAAWKKLESFNNLPGDLLRHHIPCCQVYSRASTGDCPPHDWLVQLMLLWSFSPDEVLSCAVVSGGPGFSTNSDYWRLLASHCLVDDGASLLQPGGPDMLLLKLPITSLLVLILSFLTGVQCGLLAVEMVPPLTLVFPNLHFWSCSCHQL
jgi:hypothetical protein